MTERARPCEFCDDPQGRSVNDVMAEIAAALMSGAREDYRVAICERHREELEAESELATDEDLEEMKNDPDALDFTKPTN